MSTDDVKEAKHDAESARGVGGSDDRELHRKKGLQLLGYVVAFAVFQTAIILIFVLTIMKVRTPRFRVETASLESSSSQFGTAQNPSFSLKMNAELSVKNANFGNYKFGNTTVVFHYGDHPVGEAVVWNTRAGWRSTKKLDVSVDLSSNGLPKNVKSQLGKDLSSGVLTLNSRSKLEGKVELIFIFKKKKAIDMDCTLTIGVADKSVRQTSCK